MNVNHSYSGLLSEKPAISFEEFFIWAIVFFIAAVLLATYYAHEKAKKERVVLSQKRQNYSRSLMQTCLVFLTDSRYEDETFRFIINRSHFWINIYRINATSENKKGKIEMAIYLYPYAVNDNRIPSLDDCVLISNFEFRTVQDIDEYFSRWNINILLESLSLWLLNISSSYSEHPIPIKDTRTVYTSRIFDYPVGRLVLSFSNSSGSAVYDSHAYLY